MVPDEYHGFGIEPANSPTRARAESSRVVLVDPAREHNVLELPAMQVPLGSNSAGLPLGCQVVSKPGNDHVTIATIAAALELERALGCLGATEARGGAARWRRARGESDQSARAASGSCGSFSGAGTM
jgi:hypothetical protein